MNGNQPFYIAIIAAIAIHAALGGGLEAADRWAKEKEKKPSIVVEIMPAPKEVKPPPPPEPEPEPSKAPEPTPTPVKPLPKLQKEPPAAPPKQTAPPPKQPEASPPPPPDEPPPLLEVNMASTTTGPSSVTVNATTGEGNLKGSPDGVKGGKGKPTVKPEGDPDGDPRGVPGGVKGGTGTAPLTLKSKPEVITEVRARYPDEAQAQGIEGVVKLSVVIEVDGKVSSVKVLKGLGYGLDQAAVEALKKFKFKPAMGSDDKPMKHTIVYSYVFEIDE